MDINHSLVDVANILELELGATQVREGDWCFRRKNVRMVEVGSSSEKCETKRGNKKSRFYTFLYL